MCKHWTSKSVISFCYFLCFLFFSCFYYFLLCFIIHYFFPQHKIVGLLNSCPWALRPPCWISSFRTPLGKRPLLLLLLVPLSLDFFHFSESSFFSFFIFTLWSAAGVHNDNPESWFFSSNKKQYLTLGQQFYIFSVFSPRICFFVFKINDF